ncbi:MAG: SpoVG family protein [Planctomycetota bacterium]
MEITEIRIKLMESSEDRLRAFCSITIDGSFVVRDLKIIDGANGPFVAMPSRKLTRHCERCHHKNHLRANYCNHCGKKLSFDANSYLDSPQKLYADVAHPINSGCRELIQQAVIDEFEAELQRCKQPGYRSRYDDEFSDAGEEVETALIDPPQSLSGPTKSGPKQPGNRSPNQKQFAHKPSSKTNTPAGDDKNDDDSFGAGVF